MGNLSVFSGCPFPVFIKKPPLNWPLTSPNPVLFSTSAMCATNANCFFDFFNLNNLPNARAVANADAPENPNPAPRGSSDLMLISTGSLTSFFITDKTVGKPILLLLKFISVFLLFLAVIITPLSTVNPTPNECALAGFLFQHILKMQLAFPGANALAFVIMLVLYPQLSFLQ